MIPVPQTNCLHGKVMVETYELLVMRWRKVVMMKYPESAVTSTIMDLSMPLIQYPDKLACNLSAHTQWLGSRALLLQMTIRPSAVRFANQW